MKFYYDTETADSAYDAQRKEKYSQDKESGNVGEKKVDFALKWLDKSFVKIEALSKDFSGSPCILLYNPEFVDIKQEYDHIIVGRAGVFVIETKNYIGKLIIDKYGNWIRQFNGNEVGMTNPLQQVRQHEKVLKSFLPQNICVISILCIANDKAIIEGAENSPLPIVKSDMLVEYIEQFDINEKPLSNDEIAECVKSINCHMVK